MKDTENVTLAEYSRLSEQMLNSLSSEHELYGGRWFLMALKRLLRKENPWDPKLWKSWKNVEHNHNNKSLKNELKSLGKYGLVDDYSKHILDNIKPFDDNFEIELGVCPLKMLTSEQLVKLEEIASIIKFHNFIPFTPDLIFKTFCQTELQSETILFASELIELPDRQKILFCLSKKKLCTISSRVIISGDTNVVYIRKIIKK